MGRGGLSKNNRLSVLGRLYFLCLFSHSHAAFRVALVLSPTYGTMQLIKIHSLFIRRTDAQNLSPPLLPALESQTPSSAPTRPWVQRTRGQWFSSESSRRSTETLLSHHFCVVTGLLVQLYFIQQPRHSSEDRVNQAATVNSLAMKTRRATTFLLCCFAPPPTPEKDTGQYQLHTSTNRWGVNVSTFLRRKVRYNNITQGLQLSHKQNGLRKVN